MGASLSGRSVPCRAGPPPVGLAGWLWLALADLLFRISIGFGLIGLGWLWFDLASGFHSLGFCLDLVGFNLIPVGFGLISVGFGLASAGLGLDFALSLAFTKIFIHSRLS